MKIELMDHMGNDSTVVNAARVSFSKDAANFTEDQNAKLIRYLAKHGHWSPLAHPQIQMRVTIPLFLARQYFKHIVGSVKNETSRRYVSDTPEFYMPVVWRKAPEKSIKQGSGEEFDISSNNTISDQVREFNYEAVRLYEKLLSDGMAPEQARMVLPQSTYTQFVDTGSLVYWARMYKQRTDPHAQKEWAEIMPQLDEIMNKLFPVCWSELTK